MSSLAGGYIKGVIVMINNLYIMSLREGCSRDSGANFTELYKVFTAIYLPHFR